MKIKIFGKNIEVTPGMKSAVEDKLSKLEKYFTKELCFTHLKKEGTELLTFLSSSSPLLMLVSLVRV